MQGVNTWPLSLYPISLPCSWSYSQPRPTSALPSSPPWSRIHPDFDPEKTQTWHLLSHWVSKISAYMIFWQTGSLTFLKIWGSEDMLGWNLRNSGMVSIWVSEISAYMFFWQTGCLTFLKFWGSGSMLSWNFWDFFWEAVWTGLEVWGSENMLSWNIWLSCFLVFWFQKRSVLKFWASVYLKSSDFRKISEVQILSQILFRSSDFLSSCWCV